LQWIRPIQPLGASEPTNEPQHRQHEGEGENKKRGCYETFVTTGREEEKNNEKSGIA